MHKPNVLIYDSGESVYVNLLSRSRKMGVVQLVNSRSDLMSLVKKDHKNIDLVILDQILSPEKIKHYRHRASIEFDGMTAIDIIHKRWPKINIAVLTRYWHEANVVSAYRAGVRWFSKRCFNPGDHFIDHVRQVAAGEVVIPDEFSPLLTNRIRAILDPVLNVATDTDQDMLLALMEGCGSDEIADRLNWSTRQVYYNRLSSLIADTKFSSKEALLTHARSIGFEPIVEPESLVH